MESSKLNSINFSLSSTSGASSNNSDTNRITASLMNGETPVAAVQVTFIITADNASFANDSKTAIATTDSKGECVVELKSSAPGNVKVQAVCLFSSYLTAETESYFEEISEDTYTLTATVLGSDTAPADGQKSITLVYALKAGTTPVAGQYIFVNATGSAIVEPSLLVTDAYGSATVTVTNTVAESVTISAAAALLGVEAKPVRLTFEEVVPLYTITGVVSKNDAYADGTNQNTVTFSVTETATGKPATGQVLQLLPGQGLSVDTLYVSVDITGQAVVHCTALAAASYTLKAILYSHSDISCIVEGIVFSNSEYLKGLKGVVTRNNAEAGDFNNGQDDSDYCQILYSLTKTNSRNILEGQNIYITLSSQNAHVSSKKLVTDENGLATLRVYSSVAESVTVTATTDAEGISDVTVVDFKAAPFVASGTLKGSGYYGLDAFTENNYSFIKNHSYQLLLSTSSKGTVKQHECKSGYNFVQGTTACQIINDPSFALFNDFNYDGGMVKCTNAGTATATNTYYQLSTFASLSFTLVIVDLGIN
ncbi:hypothetical protein F3J29_12775 [Enterobacter sp. Cy-643]|uniref:Ig-like domain-containing protein n=1 Tax=Enterobacter sp. Cy-643 TaxID=2608346 RepID=UPI001420089D|nr:Ig-like domain-containing protein [Enterobacter sp. Cy-643]NIF33004.1 hypothetical protein [Enterobacter sp. Cy-643]